MRLPSWVRVRSITRVAGKVTITLSADTTAFETAMVDAGSIARYQRAVAHQRSLGRAYVGVALDGLCHGFGLDPVEVWRTPRRRDQELAALNSPDREARKAAEAAWLAAHRAHRAAVVAHEERADG